MVTQTKQWYEIHYIIARTDKYLLQKLLRHTNKRIRTQIH